MMANVTDSNLTRPTSLSDLDRGARLQSSTPPTIRIDDPHGPLGDAAPDATAARSAGGVLETRELFIQAAISEVARLALLDSRVVAISSAIDEETTSAWSGPRERMFLVDSGVPHALEWSASVAVGGGRPFVFISWDELQASFGQVREICQRGAAVTLVVEGRRDLPAEQAPSSVGMCGVRQLPNLSIVAPKDAIELRQMLAWCAAADGPAVVWLSEALLPRRNWPACAAIERGVAEPLGAGEHVAIVAWGPMVEAAQLAAERMAEQGIAAQILNARFAAPLDTAALARAAREALCVVVLDDGWQNGGFASWVLDELFAIGAASNVSIVTPQPAETADTADALHEACADRSSNAANGFPRRSCRAIRSVRFCRRRRTACFRRPAAIGRAIWPRKPPAWLANGRKSRHGNCLRTPGGGWRLMRRLARVTYICGSGACTASR